MAVGLAKRIIQIWGGEREMPLLGRAAATEMNRRQVRAKDCSLTFPCWNGVSG